MSPIVQSGVRDSVRKLTEPNALGRTTIATGSLSPHATEPKVELPENLAKKISASPVDAGRAAVVNHKVFIAGSAFLFSVGEFFFNRVDYFLVVGFHLRLKPCDHLAILRHQELGEVPLDVAGGLRVGVGAGEVLIERRLALTFHDDLGEERELRLILGSAELFDLGVGAGFLLFE